MLYFHYCEKYKNTVSEQINETVVKTLKEYANRSSLKDARRFSAYSGGIYVLLIKKPHTEIIIQEKKIIIHEKEVAVCFVRGIKNGLSDYVEIKNGKWLIYNPLQEFEVDKVVDLFLLTQEKTQQKLSPPEYLTNWQDEYKLHVKYDFYETEEWVNFAFSNSSESGMKDKEALLYRLVLNDIIKPDNTALNIIFKGESITTYSHILNDIGVVFSKLLVENEEIYLLHGGANVKTQKIHWEQLVSKDFSEFSHISSLEEVGSKALKAYPSWALKDADLWAKIEKNNEMGNLSLLPEQTTFLKNFQFPKYINGQAGSGKSTMLYYLFANAYYFKYAGTIKGDIIFLTENERLLTYTRNSVLDLLMFNPEFELSSEDIAITSVSKHFSAFKDFLLSKLPEDNLSFEKDKYLDFSKFKLLYEQSTIQNHIKKRYSSELVWFTISTYVFGYDLEYLITSENYETKMPKEGKELISFDDFSEIERFIINPFYKKLLEDGYWDKIKLIKYLYENIDTFNRYEIIFCDEAQDFSRVELKFILNLSIYHQYDLANVKQFPIVFAGDALQTVNPTGFRTEVLTAMIYQELTNIGFKLDPNNLVFSPTYNYRSSQTIVNIANAVQWYRKKTLGASIEYPQKSKRPLLRQNHHLNVFVSFESFNSDSSLQKKVTLKTIIVPVNKDEIEAYKTHFPILNNYQNIISAVDAKGIDFSEVVIFGFGDWFLREIEGEYETRFFYNKLYVAITRAQAELVIIDSDDAQTEFWRKLLIDNYIPSDWNRNDPENSRINNFEDIIVFDANEIIQSSNTIVEEEATRQKEQGIATQNIALLQVASSHFVKLEKLKEYYLCLGEIEEIKGDWIKAADFYLKKDVGLEGVEKAANVYWKGKHLHEVINIGKSLKNDKQLVRNIITKLFLDKVLMTRELKDLVDHITILKEQISDISWCNEVVSNIQELLSESIDEQYIQLVADILENICSKSDEKVWAKLGETYFKLKRYEPAITAFEKIADKEKYKSYAKAKVEVAKRRNDEKEIILELGLLIEITDDASEILHLQNEIISYYYQISSEINDKDDIYIKKYAYCAFLSVKPNYENLLFLAQDIEQLFEKKRRELELAEMYLFLLEKINLNSNLLLFVLERWSKNSLEGGIPIEGINECFEKLEKFKNITFEPFTEMEIREIPRIPVVIQKGTSEHIRNIQIKNFRQFKNANVENLGLFNLIVGDNNIGKTSFLEALLFTPEKKNYLERLAFAYIERVNIHPDKDKSDSSINSKLYYSIKKDFSCTFLCCQEPRENIQFVIKEKRNIRSFEIAFEGNGISHGDKDVITFNNDDYNSLLDIPYLNGVKQPFMPYGKGFGNDLAQIYDTEIRPNRKIEDTFLKNMKLFIPKIERIYASLDGTIDIRDGDFQEDRPLNQYGEGANKLFRILILLTLHKGKRLLIDEIDAGIHYSKFKEFWKFILEIGHRDNTQIFATTHNEECIRYFAEVLNELGESYQKESRVVQMKMVKNIKIRSYEYDSFNLAIEDGIEIRGGN